MSFTRSTTDISVHQKLGDYPNQDNGLTPEELKKEEANLKEELFRLRFKNATSPIENPMKLRFLKRDIARVKTAIRAKEISFFTFIIVALGSL